MTRLRVGTDADQFWVGIEVDSTPDGSCTSFTEGLHADNANADTVANCAAWSFSTR